MNAVALFYTEDATMPVRRVGFYATKPSGIETPTIASLLHGHNLKLSASVLLVVGVGAVGPVSAVVHQLRFAVTPRHHPARRHTARHDVV